MKIEASVKTEAEPYFQREKEEGLTLSEDGSAESQESGGSGRGRRM